MQQTSVEMPAVGAGADKESIELLARLNAEAKGIRSKRIQDKEDRERERFAADCLGSESSVEEVEEVVPPTPSKFVKY